MSIRDLRIEAGLTIKETAMLLNIKPCTLYKIEREERKASPLLKLKIAKLFECSINDL